MKVPDDAPEDDAAAISTSRRINRLVAPLLELHESLLQSTFGRLVAWERAAVEAGAARTHFQAVLSGANRAQWTRRRRALRQLRQRNDRQRKSPRRQEIPAIEALSNEALSESSSESP